MNQKSSRETTNDLKRDQMRRYTNQLMEAKGWTVAQLGAVFGVSESTIRAWKAGKSMGTNDQRHQLWLFHTQSDIGPMLRQRRDQYADDLAQARKRSNLPQWVAACERMLVIVDDMVQATTLKNG